MNNFLHKILGPRAFSSLNKNGLKIYATGFVLFYAGRVSLKTTSTDRYEAVDIADVFVPLCWPVMVPYLPFYFITKLNKQKFALEDVKKDFKVAIEQRDEARNKYHDLRRETKYIRNRDTIEK